MYQQKVKPKENNKRTVANAITQKKSNVKQGCGMNHQMIVQAPSKSTVARSNHHRILKMFKPILNAELGQKFRGNCSPNLVLEADSYRLETQTRP